jgi:hypothetical protein
MRRRRTRERAKSCCLLPLLTQLVIYLIPHLSVCKAGLTDSDVGSKRSACGSVERGGRRGRRREKRRRRRRRRRRTNNLSLASAAASTPSDRALSRSWA